MFVLDLHLPSNGRMPGSLTDGEGSALEATAAMAFGPGGSWFSSCMKKPMEFLSGSIQREVFL